MDVSIIIPNQNGRQLLEEFFPSVVRAVKKFDGEAEIIVVDSESKDKSVEFLFSEYPGVIIEEISGSFNFSRAMNAGVRKAIAPLLIFLNNDTAVDEDFIFLLLRHFKENQFVFAVGARMLFWGRTGLNFGRALPNFFWGVFSRTITDATDSIPSLYACAGGCAVNREKFLELGGFDEDFYGYWEDLDLCYRAWKRGWQVLYEPRSEMYHRVHATSLKEYGRSGIDALSGEHYLLFTIKNIHHWFYFARHAICLPFLVFYSCCIGKPFFARGMFRALKRAGLFWEKRRMEKMKARVSDQSIFSMLN